MSFILGMLFGIAIGWSMSQLMSANGKDADE